jgi:excisionase family DNA binding protein
MHAMPVDARSAQQELPKDPERAAARRMLAAKRAKRRKRLARNLLEDQTRRDWLESKMMRPGEVALVLQVSRRTVSDWARAGRIPFILTPGGHRRFRARDVRRLVETMTEALGHSRS